MEKLQYGNWIRRRVLWMLGLASLAFGLLACLPFPALVRAILAMLAIGMVLSFLYPLYAYITFSHSGGNLQEKFYDLILSHLDGTGSGNLLDIGTGNGILAIKAAVRDPSLDVTGVDYWGDDWEYAQSVCEKNAKVVGVDGRIQFKKGNAAALDYPDSCFDQVVSNLTFHEVKLVKRKSDVMREALRLLKPGGRFAFIDYFYDEKYYGEKEEFQILLWSLKLQQVTLQPLQNELTFPGLLRHKRALGRVGIVYGKK